MKEGKLYSKIGWEYHLFDSVLLVSIPLLCFLAWQDLISFIIMVALAVVHVWIGFVRYCQRKPEINWSVPAEIITIVVAGVLFWRSYFLINCSVLFRFVAVFVAAGHIGKLWYPEKPYYCCLRSNTDTKTNTQTSKITIELRF